MNEYIMKYFPIILFQCLLPAYDQLLEITQTDSSRPVLESHLQRLMEFYALQGLLYYNCVNDEGEEDDHYRNLEELTNTDQEMSEQTVLAIRDSKVSVHTTKATIF